MLRIGILGLGEGRSTMSAALKSELLELRMICDLNEDLCKQRAREFGFDKYTTSYLEMLEDKSIDLVAIYTPDRFHAEHIKLALEHGKHVVCTKPLMDDLEMAGTLLETALKTGKKVFVGQSSRFFEPMMRQRKDYLEKKLGEIITIEAYYHADHRWFLGKKWALEDTFRWLYGGLSHPADLVRWYLPDIEEIMGYGMISRNGLQAGLKNEDTMHFILRTKSGKPARISGAYSGPIQPQSRDSEMSCIIRGTEGCSQADYMDLRYAITDNQGEESMISFEKKSTYYFRFEGKTHHAGEYQNYLEYVVACIENGETAYPDLSEGIGTVAVLKAMEISLASGKPVKVSEVLKKYGLEAHGLNKTG